MQRRDTTSFTCPYAGRKSNGFASTNSDTDGTNANSNGHTDVNTNTLPCADRVAIAIAIPDTDGVAITVTNADGKPDGYTNTHSIAALLSIVAKIVWVT